VADRIGQQLGNYRLVSLLGQGGYAEVYLGQHVRFKQQAAIKVLHAHLSEQEAEHFQQEAETIAQLSHPSIVRVLDFDVQEGIPFLVIDYAPNGSLRQRYPKGNLVPLPVIVSVAKQVADALQYAHEQKFIHRDVKPENMLLGRRQEVLLSDFGIATIAHNTSSLNVDAQGTSGTLAYMAPEQIEGHPRAASDQYALGVVVYEWLCGERPFEGSASELIAQHLSMSPPPLRERMPAIPPEVEQVVLRALAKDPKARFASVADFSAALEQASQHVHSSTAKHPDEQPLFGVGDSKGYETGLVEPARSKRPTESTPSADLAVGALEPTMYPDSSAPNGFDSPQSGAVAEMPQGQIVAPTAAVVSPPLEPTMPVQRKATHLPRSRAALLIGLVVVIIVGGILGSVSLLAHFGVIGTGSGATTASPVRGGTWTEDYFFDPGSLIPQGGGGSVFGQALYLPLFYGDAQGVPQPGAATEVPTVQNSGISTDAKTWTFHLKPHLMWSDGQPYDARDVDFTWKLWTNPKFGGSWPLPPNLITSADVSADDLSITFHLIRAYTPFLSYWVDDGSAPLPAHHFRRMAPDQILKLPENENPQVVSGPFVVSESKPSDHFTLVRNSRYYRAREGLPYLDKLVIRIANQEATLRDLQAGIITSSYPLDAGQVPEFQRLTHYTLVTSPTDGGYEAMYFNFHNAVLASHPEVRQAMAIAIDHQALIQEARLGFASQLCTDHPSANHPGYEASLPCAPFDPAAANKLLDDNGWFIGPDGVRAKGEQRLEFEYSTAIFAFNTRWRLDTETILQRNMKALGIKLDIQNYSFEKFFPPNSSFLSGGKSSPPTGAVAGRYDIAEFAISWNYDPDDSWLLSYDQIPPKGVGSNIDFYCNHALDALYQQELATADDGARQNIFHQIHQIYLTALPFIVLYSTRDIAMAHKGTHNYQINPFMGETNIWGWWCDGGKC
jgi:ABC-type transport system substrate-binding protein/serine/threonine protein kinase